MSKQDVALPVLTALVLALIAFCVGVVWVEGFVLSTILSWFGVGLSIFKSIVILLFANFFVISPLQRSRRAA